MSGNWLKASVIGLILALFTPAIAAAQNEATLDTVVVTASRAEESLREVSSNVTVITEKQIKNSTANNMLDLLKQQGFYTPEFGSGDGYVQIRGVHSGQSVMSETRVLVLINGRRTGITNLTPVGLSNIERVEIIRGPAAVQYGSAAIGGVVNIITKRGKEGEFWAAAETGLGNFDLYKNSLSFGGAANNIDFSVGITHLKRGVYETNPVPTKQLVYDSFGGKTSMNLDLGYTLLEKHRLGLNFDHYKAKDQKTGMAGSWGTADMIGDNKNDNLAFSYEGTTNDEQFNWSAVYSFGKTKFTSDGVYDYGFMTDEEFTSTEQDINAFTGQVGYNGQMVSTNIGLDYNSLEVRSVYYGNNKTDNLGTFFSGKLRLLDESLIFTAGGRYDSFTQDSHDNGRNGKKTHFSPSVGVSYLPLDWLKVRTNYSQGFLMPSAEQLYGDHSSVYYGAIGDPDLVPEKSKTFEFGADVNYQALSIGLTYFHTNWDNKIVTLPLNNLLYNRQWTNLKQSTLVGLEFSISGDIGQMLDQSFELRPYLNLTYFTSRKNKDRDTFIDVNGTSQDTLPHTPKYTFNYGVTFNHPGHDLLANINGTYLGETLINSTAGYHTYGNVSVDLSLEKGIWDFTDKSKLKLRTEVNNLFNNDNMVMWGYPGPERSFYVGLKYEYN